ncbi:MAG TPA: 16S rRNA (cytosine(967)-C(5))-methyltransferase RsmB [Solirubrobacteraceae bacterium]
MPALRAGRVSPARACAFAVVRRVFEQGAYADRALAGEAAGLEPRERALAMALAYGAVQRRATLDHIAAELSARPLDRLDAPVLAALRLGLLQLLFLDGIAEHAAVHESVELVKTAGGGGSGLVNAVLRRATREGRALLDALSDETPDEAAIRHSVPVWLAELWWRELGADRARALLATINEPAESALRVNTLVADLQTVRAALPVAARTVPGLPDALILEAPFDLHGSELWRDGAIMAQSRGSMLPARVLDPAPGARVLDLCAAPGAKTSQLAALLGAGHPGAGDRARDGDGDGDGEIVAVERHPGRARALERTLARMGASWVTVVTADATGWTAPAPFDCVLVDPPCSGLGTLQSRPDLRWRTSPERIADLSGVQARVLRAGAAATAPGGTVVYSVCTISRAESEDVIEDFLAEHSDFELAELGTPPVGALEGGFVRTMPDRDGTDGFFVARMQRSAAPRPVSL